MPPSNNQPTAVDHLLATISVVLQDTLWRIVGFAIKAVLLLFLWNGFVSSIFTLPQLAFGNAFAIVAIITVLFSNLNGHSKFQTRHLFDLKSLVYQLIVNQHSQNTAIMGLLSRSETQSNENDKTVLKTDKEVDEGTKKDYNTDESEN